MIAGVRAELGIKLFGDDFEVLREKAGEIREAVEAVPGAADVTVEQVTGQPILEIEVDRDAIARHGIAAQHVLEIIESLGPREVGEVREGQRRFGLAVRLDERYTRDAESIGRILVAAPGGQRIPLAQLTKIRVSEGASTINREWAKRRVVVQSNVKDRDIGSFVEEVRRTIDEKVKLPAGYYVTYGGQFENLERARQRLMIVVPIALMLIFALLYVTYGRMLDALRVFTGVPFAAIGGVAALWLRDMPFSISAGVGFVALSGVSVLGDMVLVSQVRLLLGQGYARLDAIREAAVTRLRPVLMTSMVAALGFLPMALNTGVGAEVQRPLATVVIGGIFSSTLATLLVLPVLYALLGSRGPSQTAVQNLDEDEPDELSRILEPYPDRE
jgi:cobalt-zinc-cadmium resistance protein CzcA